MGRNFRKLKAAGNDMSLFQVAATLSSLFFYSAFSVALVSGSSYTSRTWQWNEKIWNPNKSYAVYDSPELVPGSILGSSGASSTTASSSAAPMALFNLSRRDSSNIGSGTFGLVIVGCAIPPLVGLAVLFCYLRRRSLAKAAVSADVCASQPQQPQSDEVVLPPITMRIYDPDDPTTFPSQVTMPSNIEAGSTLANTQPSLPQAGLARGYHGLPIV